jgi:biopolymer transport protein ExbD
MKIKKARAKILEGDLTPMIDMTFLLIAFFMLIINFSKVEKDQELELPDSRIARPPDEPPDYQIVLNMRLEQDVPLISFSGNQITGIENIGIFLQQEIAAASITKKGIPPGKIDVVIRADRNLPTGLVKDLMAKCQTENLQKFSLRAKEDIQ